MLCSGVGVGAAAIARQFAHAESPQSYACHPNVETLGASTARTEKSAWDDLDRITQILSKDGANVGCQDSAEYSKSTSTQPFPLASNKSSACNGYIVF